MENPKLETKEKQPESFVAITWPETGVKQKFVDFEDGDGNYYIYSGLMSANTQHIDMVGDAVKHFTIIGEAHNPAGGTIAMMGNEIYAMGESMSLRKKFNIEKATAALAKAYPDNELVIE